MIHRVDFVAKTNNLPVDEFVAFCATHRDVWKDGRGVLITTTIFVEKLIDDFKATK